MCAPRYSKACTRASAIRIGYTDEQKALILANSGEYVFSRPYLDGMPQAKHISN